MKVTLVVLIGVCLLYDGYCLADRAYSQSTFIQRGIASWYGREENGKLTASGERFNRHEFTAASRHLPFNTVVRVTNRTNGRSVEVRINDRGPYVHGRILDLSEAAADSLDMKQSGTAPVEIQVLDTAAQTVPLGLPDPSPAP